MRQFDLLDALERTNALYILDKLEFKRARLNRKTKPTLAGLSNKKCACEIENYTAATFYDLKIEDYGHKTRLLLSGKVTAASWIVC